VNATLICTSDFSPKGTAISPERPICIKAGSDVQPFHEPHLRPNLQNAEIDHCLLTPRGHLSLPEAQEGNQATLMLSEMEWPSNLVMAVRGSLKMQMQCCRHCFATWTTVVSQSWPGPKTFSVCGSGRPWRRTWLGVGLFHRIAAPKNGWQRRAGGIVLLLAA